MQTLSLHDALPISGADTLHRYPSNELPFELVNNYGPTECTVVATSARVRTSPRPYIQSDHSYLPIQMATRLTDNDAAYPRRRSEERRVGTTSASCSPREHHKIR